VECSNVLERVLPPGYFDEALKDGPVLDHEEEDSGVNLDVCRGDAPVHGRTSTLASDGKSVFCVAEFSFTA